MKQAFLMRRPIPDRIRNAPVLRPGLELYLEAFYDLNTCRPPGWGIVPIPWSAAKDYASANEFSEVQTERLLKYAPVMDAAFIKHHESKQPKK